MPTPKTPADLVQEWRDEADALDGYAALPADEVPAAEAYTEQAKAYRECADQLEAALAAQKEPTHD